MKTEYQYIRFADVSHQGQKTRVFACQNSKSGFHLGFVRWYRNWRQYCFEPSSEDLVFSAGCLADIQDFIKQLSAGSQGGFPRTDSGLSAQGYQFEAKGKCKGCQADIEWWLTAKQKHIPLDAGTLELHWSTCPKAKDFKK